VVVLAPELERTPYWELHGRPLRRPAQGEGPSRELLVARWKSFSGKGVPGSGGLWTTQPAQTLVALRCHAEHATMPKTGCWAVARPRRSCGLFVIHCTNRVIVIPMLS
jgi:hypothetical protein